MNRVNIKCCALVHDAVWARLESPSLKASSTQVGLDIRHRFTGNIREWVFLRSGVFRDPIIREMRRVLTKGDDNVA